MDVKVLVKSEVLLIPSELVSKKVSYVPSVVKVTLVNFNNGYPGVRRFFPVI